MKTSRSRASPASRATSKRLVTKAPPTYLSTFCMRAQAQAQPQTRPASTPMPRSRPRRGAPPHLQPLLQQYPSQHYPQADIARVREKSALFLTRKVVVGSRVVGIRLGRRVDGREERLHHRVGTSCSCRRAGWLGGVCGRVADSAEGGHVRRCASAVGGRLSTAGERGDCL